jgi:hypothetical protein
LIAKGRTRRPVAPEDRDIGIEAAGGNRIRGVPASSSALRPITPGPAPGFIFSGD